MDKTFLGPYLIVTIKFGENISIYDKNIVDRFTRTDGSDERNLAWVIMKYYNSFYNRYEYENIYRRPSSIQVEVKK